MENLIAAATFLKMKLDFKKDVKELEDNRIMLLASDGSEIIVRCYVAKYNPKTDKVVTNTIGDENFSVLFFPQKSNKNVILVNGLQFESNSLSDITENIISKWEYEV